MGKRKIEIRKYLRWDRRKAVGLILNHAVEGYRDIKSELRMKIFQTVREV